MYKKVALLVAFFVFFGVNLFFITQLFIRSSVSHKQARLLREITESASPKQSYTFSAAPLVLGAVEAEAKLSDSRADALRAFFREYESPLYENANTFVREADN